MSTPAPTLRTLVAGLVDYAGLFPPAALGMTEAARNYAEYRVAPECWMLGRFVVPVARLGELSDAIGSHGTHDDAVWPVAALASGADHERDAARIAEFHDASDGKLSIDVVEVRTTFPDDVRRAATTFERCTVYCEVPLGDDPREVLKAVKECGVRAKARTGGVTTDAFPSPENVARFIARCAELDVPFKATAGLHHPLRAQHRLTYADDAPVGEMFGFINVFAAGAFARTGMEEPMLARLLVEADPSSLHFGDDELTWRGHSVSAAELAEARTLLAVAFGSCSFREPVDDLRQLGLL